MKYSKTVRFEYTPPTLKNLRLLRTTKETTLDMPGQTENLWDEYLLMWWTFSPKKNQFPMALSNQSFTLPTPTTVSVFLKLNICFAEITDPALDAIRTFNICKLFRTFFFCVHRLAAYWNRFTLVFWLLSKCWKAMNGTNLTHGKIWQHGRSNDFNAQDICEREMAVHFIQFIKDILISYSSCSGAFSRNCIQNIASLFFLHKHFPFMHRVATFTLSVPDSDT